MRYIVENYHTDEIIAEFDSEQEREKWLDKNVSVTLDNDNEYVALMEDGTRIDIYEIATKYEVLVNGVKVASFKRYMPAEKYLINRFGENWYGYDCGIVRG